MLFVARRGRQVGVTVVLQMGIMRRRGRDCSRWAFWQVWIVTGRGDISLGSDMSLSCFIA